MTSNAVTALRAELLAARDLLLPQIRGFELILCSAEGDVRNEIARELADHVRRLSLIDGVSAALDALDADGYPEMPLAEVSSVIFAELQQKLSDAQAAIAEFEILPDATTLTIELGDPVDKPE